MSLWMQIAYNRLCRNNITGFLHVNRAPLGKCLISSRMNLCYEIVKSDNGKEDDINKAYLCSYLSKDRSNGVHFKHKPMFANESACRALCVKLFSCFHMFVCWACSWLNNISSRNAMMCVLYMLMDAIQRHYSGGTLIFIMICTIRRMVG